MDKWLDILGGITGVVYEAIYHPLRPDGYTDLSEYSSVLLNQIGDESEAEIYLPDEAMPLYKIEQVKTNRLLKRISKRRYIRISYNCDNFAADAFAAGIGLVWIRRHALNFFIDTDLKLWFYEPQNRTLTESVDDAIRFLLGR